MAQFRKDGETGGGHKVAADWETLWSLSTLKRLRFFLKACTDEEEAVEGKMVMCFGKKSIILYISTESKFLSF